MTRVYTEGLRQEFTPDPGEHADSDNGVDEDGRRFNVVPLEKFGVSWA